MESSAAVRESLLASMASRSQEAEEYADIVESQFGKQAPDSPLRRRLLAASQNSPLYVRLKAIAAAQANALQGILIHDLKPTPQILVEGDLIVGPSIKAGRDVNAQTINLGEMINSANGAIQQLQRSDEATAAILREVMDMLAATRDHNGKAEVAAAVKELASTPSKEAKKTLIDRIKSFGAGAAAAGGAIGGLDKLIEAIGNIIV